MRVSDRVALLVLVILTMVIFGLAMGCQSGGGTASSSSTSSTVTGAGK